MCRFVVALFPAILAGQTLRISPASASAGQKISIEVSYDGPSQGGPVALRWDFIFPVQSIAPEGSGPEIGEAAKESGKSITCISHKEYSYTCLLAGGENSLAKGILAIYHFRIRDNAARGEKTFRISQATGSTIDLHEVKLSDAEAKLEVH